MTIRLWLVRHGATDWSDQGRLNGWTDVSLNHRGKAQAQLLRLRLGRREFTGVFSSDLARAAETARIAIGEPVLESRLREIDFGDLEGKRWGDLSIEAKEALLGFDSFVASGGESVAVLRQRVAGFLQDLPEGNHALLTHGGVIRLLMRMAGCDFPVPLGGVVRLQVTGVHSCLSAFRQGT